MRLQAIKVVLIAGLLALYIWVVAAVTAHAAVTPLWAALQVQPGVRPTLAQLGPFSAVSGLPVQRVAGKPYWTYTKGSRSYSAQLPEAWYIHQDGTRVRDKKFGSYVMNPGVVGWQAYVAQHCPAQCFLDGLGTTSLDRTTPHLTWSTTQWVAAVASELRYVQARGHALLPNSVGMPSLTLASITGQVSTESFSAGSLPIVTASHTYVYEVSDCGYKVALFLTVAGPGDLFACHDAGASVLTVPRALAGPAVGSPLGPAVRTVSGWVRHFQHATVTVNLKTHTYLIS